MSPPSGRFEILAIDSDHVSAVAFNMLFIVWQRRTVPATIRAVVASLKEHSARHPEGIGLMQVLEERSSAPEPETRQILPEVLGAGNIQHFSITYVGTGFRAAAIRATLTAIVWSVRPRFEHSIHTNLSAAAVWHAQRQRRIGRKESAGDIEYVMSALRVLHRERYPDSAPPGSASAR